MAKSFYPGSLVVKDVDEYFRCVFTGHVTRITGRAGQYVLVYLTDGGAIEVTEKVGSALEKVLTGELSVEDATPVLVGEDE